MNFSSINFILANCLLLSVALHAENPPAGFEKVDQEITISTLEAQMKYGLYWGNDTRTRSWLIIAPQPGNKEGGDTRDSPHGCG